MEILSKAVPVAMLAFVVSSMLAAGVSLTVAEILAPLRNYRLVFFALLANKFILVCCPENDCAKLALPIICRRFA